MTSYLKIKHPTTRNKLLNNVANELKLIYKPFFCKKQTEKIRKFDKNRIICYNKKHNLRVYLGLPNLSDKGQLK